MQQKIRTATWKPEQDQSAVNQAYDILMPWLEISRKIEYTTIDTYYKIDSVIF